MLKQWIVLVLSTAFLLTACHDPVYNQSQGNVADVKLRQEAQRKRQDINALPPSSLLVKQGPYVDMTPISVAGQPSWLRNHIVIRGDQLPFSYYSRTITNGASKTILTKFQVGLDPSQQVSISYSGTIKGALDLLASKTGFVYSIMGNTVYWQAFVTRTFDIAFMPGGTEYLMGKSSGGGAGGAGGGGGGGGSSGGGGGSSSGSTQNYTTSDMSDSEYTNLSGKLSVWKDMQEAIMQMLSPEGRVTVSQATTTITVRDKPTNVNLIGQYIANINKNLSRQALVKVQILEVQLSNNYNYGINWGIIASAFNKSPFVLSANYGTPIILQQTLSGSTIPIGGISAANNPKSKGGPNGFPSYTILLNALSQQGKTSLVSEPRVVCLNNQVSVIRIVTQEGYAASVQNTSTGAGGTTTAAQNTVTSQITPGSVTTGVTIYILPKIMKDKIYLQVNADLSINNGFQNFTPGQTTNNPTQASIQLPNVTSKHFSQRSLIRSGDTLIMSGFRQMGNEANAMQFMRSQALGGKASQETNTETIILITPIILDEIA
jgi:type IVB pilus formation R64 PilN family outer membrane protein